VSTAAPEDAERRSIRDAMERLLEGSPLHSDGKLTVKSLADEAQVKRWLLTHRHTDLQDEFRAKVDQHGRVPEALQKLLDEKEALKDRITKLSADLAMERETVKRLERVVHVLTLEREQERQAATPKANVRPLRPGT
jgi:AraC-like DNA-binding protein